jgi:maleate isomerase
LAHDTTRWQPDGWTARTRIGVVVPHADVGPEAEFAAMAPPEVTVHGARLQFAAMRAGGEMDEKIPHAPVAEFTAAPVLDDTVGALAEAPLDAIALAFTSSAYKHGPQGERDLLERLRPRTRGLPVVSTCLSAERALARLGARRIAIVNPAWFDADLDRQGGDYFATQGFEVVHHAPCGLPSGQEHVTPQALYDWIAGLTAQHALDAVFVGGNGQRAVGVIDAVERNLGVDLVTANQAILWDALRQAGETSAVRGYGRLFG